jgi:PadR family transcriptional regulator, regulatory protein PadR
MSRIMPRGMKVGAVSLWLLLVLSEKPMYGYEVIRELEKRFSGYWKPKTGTVYPAIQKLEQNGLVTSHIDFPDELPDRKHYALTVKGHEELSQSMTYWTKMSEVLENYREVHESLARHKVETDRKEVSRALMTLSSGFKDGKIVLSEFFPVENDMVIEPTEPLKFKFLYAKENQKLEIHMEIEWLPKGSTPAAKAESLRPEN